MAQDDMRRGVEETCTEILRVVGEYSHDGSVERGKQCHLVTAVQHWREYWGVGQNTSAFGATTWMESPVVRAIVDQLRWLVDTEAPIRPSLEPLIGDLAVALVELCVINTMGRRLQLTLNQDSVISRSGRSAPLKLAVQKGSASLLVDTEKAQCRVWAPFTLSEIRELATLLAGGQTCAGVC